MDQRLFNDAMNAALFRDERPHAEAPTWRHRLERVKHYLATVWRAVKGDDPYSEYDD